MPGQHGLRWKSTIWCIEPEWTVEPQVEAISDVIRQILPSDMTFEIKFLKQGAFNKLYAIKHGNSNLIIRVSLPVEPTCKTLSEVATVDFVEQSSDLPVPTVQCFSSNNSNPIGFEWIIMNHMPGVSMEEQWIYMHWSAKEALIKQMAFYAVSMFQKQFQGIGNLFPDMKEITSAGFIQYLRAIPQSIRKQRDISQTFHNRATATSLLHPGAQDTASPIIDRIVSMEFFWGDRVLQDVPRGPFRSSHDWLAARLLVNENEKAKILRESDDEDDREEAEKALRIILRLKVLLPSFFPAEETGERSMLFHEDMSWHNILVDEKGELTAILDWECVSVLPLWKACDIPAFLEDKPRGDRPNEDSYKKDEAGKVDKLYWAHLLQYEVTQLRCLFLVEMQRLGPDWFKVYMSSHAKRDFDIAVRHCDSPICMRSICKWLDTVEEGGSECSLYAKLME